MKSSQRWGQALIAFGLGSQGRCGHRFQPAVLSVLVASACYVLSTAQVQAQEARVSFDIPAQSLSLALDAFARQSGAQLLFSPEDVSGKQAQAISGQLTPAAALSRMLAGSGLQVIHSGGGVYTLRASPADTDSTQLAPITVRGRSGLDAVDGYVASNSLGAMKGDVSLLETPQSVSVVTARQMRDQGVQSLNEALRYTAGVRTESSGAQPMDNAFYLRGFQQISLDMFYDGLRGATPGYFGFFAPETYGLERVEVLKGPSSVLYGQQVPGGLVNSVSKRPSANPVNEVALTLGSFRQREAAFDVGGTNQDQTVQYRLVGMGRLANTQVEHVKNDRVYIAPSVTWQPTADTRLTLLTSYQRNKGDFYGLVPAAAILLPNSNGHIPFSRFLGEPGWEGETSERLALGYEFEHHFNDQVSVNQNLRYTHQRNDRQYLQSSGPLLNERMINRRYTVREIENDGLVVDSRLNVQASTGPLEHKVTLGFDYLWGKSNWLEQTGTASPIDIYNPVYGNIPDTQVYASRSLSDITANQAGLYLQDQIKWNKWLLTLGGRQDWAWRDTDDLIRGSSVRQRDSAFTGRAGLTYLSDSGWAPYVSFAESFTPLIGTDRHGDPYVPETGQQWELGVKYQAPGSNSMITLSAFDLRRQNVQTMDPLGTSWTDYVQTGEVRVRGVELEAVASLDQGLNLVAAYTYNHAQITKTNTANQLGNTPYRVPTHVASLWLNYEFQNPTLAGLKASVGTRYTGKTWGDDDNTFRVPAFTLVDVGLGYDFGKKFPQYKGLNLSLNVANLFNKYYVPSCATVNSCNYGSERSVVGRLSYRW